MKDQLDRLDARLDAIGQRLGEKEVRIPVDLVTGGLFALVALVIFWVMPEQVVVSEKDLVNGRAFPSLLMAVMLLCCVMLIGKELFQLATKQPIAWKTINLLVEVKALVILLILAGTYFLSKITGLFVIGGVFCCLGFLVYFRCRKPSYYLITVALAVGIWAAFRFVLGVDF